MAIGVFWGGWKTGFATRVFSWLGAILGGLACLWFAPRVVGLFNSDEPGLRFSAGVAFIWLGIGLGREVGKTLGRKARWALPVPGLRLFDRVSGAALGVLMFAVFIWAVIPAFATIPGWPQAQATNSEVVRFIDEQAPAAPPILDGLRETVARVVPNLSDRILPE